MADGSVGAPALPPASGIRRGVSILARLACALRRGARNLSIPLAGLVFAAFVALPLLTLFVRDPWSQTLSVLGNPIVKSAVEVSLISTSVATGLTAIFGVPLGYLLARYRFPGKAIVTGLVYFPLVLPPLVAGILLELVWGQSGTIEQFLEPRGLLFVDELSGIVLCQIFVSSPFIVVAARSAFERLDQDLEEAARTMGADTLRVFWSIAVPLSLRSIMAGITLSWMRSFGEFGATSIVAYHPFSFPIYVSEVFGTIPFAQMLPLALLAVVMCAVVLTIAAALERVGVVGLIIGRLTARRTSPSS